MADISKIKLPDGNTYNIKDTISGYQKELIAGTNITITPTLEGPVISSSGASGTAVSVTSHKLVIVSGIQNGDGVSY